MVMDWIRSGQLTVALLALWDATRKLNNPLGFKTSIRTALSQARLVKGQLDRYESTAP